MKTPADDAIVTAVQGLLPAVQGIWLYGSRADGTEAPASDLDLAVLMPNRSAYLWPIGEELVLRWQMDVDLIDIRTADVILQSEILKGRCLFAAGPEAELYELYILSAKRDWDFMMAPLLKDIMKDGRIYG